MTFQLIRLDDLPEIQASEHPITFIKIDVEGHEHSALLGASETLRRHGPIIAMEVPPNDVENGTTASIDFLRSLGYANFYELNEGGWLGRQPRRRKQLARTLLTILTSRRPSKAKALAQVEVLEKRTYLMLLCSIEPLKQVFRDLQSPSTVLCCSRQQPFQQWLHQTPHTVQRQVVCIEVKWLAVRD